jgi:hypothetical protein
LRAEWDASLLGTHIFEERITARHTHIRSRLLHVAVALAGVNRKVSSHVRQTLQQDLWQSLNGEVGAGSMQTLIKQFTQRFQAVPPLRFLASKLFLKHWASAHLPYSAAVRSSLSPSPPPVPPPSSFLPLLLLLISRTSPCRFDESHRTQALEDRAREEEESD